MRALREWLEREGVDLPLHLTLLLLLLVPVGQWNVRPMLLLLACAGLLHRGVLRSPWLWAALAALTGWRVVEAWPAADNHAYLLAYWCLALGIARALPDPEAAQARSARWLIGATFVFAAAWKLALSDDFLDGRFFRVTLLTDPRFEGLARWLGGMTREGLDASRTFLFQSRVGPALTVPPLVEPPALRQAALALTWISAAAESLVAVLFVAPFSGIAPHLALLAFCAGTYALAPVEGFGWLLLALGAAAAPVDATRVRTAYVACFALLMLYTGLHA